MTLQTIRNWTTNRTAMSILDVAISLLVFILAFSAVAYRIDQAPDIFTDEIIYTRASIRISGEGALVWDSGEPFLVHPPLYFLLQALHEALNGDPNTPLGPGDVFASVIFARKFNAVLAGLTALLVYIFGKRLHSRVLGLLLASIFLLDPFGVRINRRAMLETLAGLLSLAGLAAFFSMGEIRSDLRPTRLRRLPNIPVSSQVILPGLLLGAALLAKELTFLNLLVVLIFGLWEAFRGFSPFVEGRYWRAWLARLPALLPSLATIGLAVLTYTLYPLWVLTSGLWPGYAREKTLELQRLVGLVQLSGWNRPGVSLLDYLVQRLTDYGSSYFVIALGALGLVGLFIWGRQKQSGRLLITWGLVAYPFFFFVALVGSGNDQFFYFLLIPATFLAGYAAITMIDYSQVLLSSKRVESTWYLVICYIFTWASRLAVVGLLLITLPYNIFRWWNVFGVNQDNGYAQFTQFVDANVPPGVSVNASGDPIKFHYFLPDRPIFARSTPEEAMKDGIHYFALTPKDVQFRYGSIQPELASWIQENGTPLFSYKGNSYGDIFLYHVDYPTTNPAATESNLTAGQTHWRSYQPAHGGFVDSLVLSLTVWCLAWGALYLGPRQFYGTKKNWV